MYLLVQELILTLVVSLIKDPKLSNKIQMHLISSQTIRTMDLNDLPSIARDKMLGQGRLLLAMLLVAVVFRVLY